MLSSHPGAMEKIKCSKKNRHQNSFTLDAGYQIRKTLVNAQVLQILRDSLLSNKCSEA
jgi:hypothetical protein